VTDTAPHRACGRTFGADEIAVIRTLIADHPEANRARLSRMVCEALDWRRENGGLKDMSCRVAMLRMHNDGLIELPPPTKGNGNGRRYQRRTLFAEPRAEVMDTPAGALADTRLVLVEGQAQSHLWNEYVDRYHYLGYTPLPGAQLRYMAMSGREHLAMLGFGAAAWKTAPRDRFIGWTAQQRKARLHLVVNNARFLILPWIQSRNLASRLLAMATRRLPDDWEEHYGYRPVLAETFVDTGRFRGTCYAAANWTCVGKTQGRGKLDVDHSASLPVKTIWVRALARSFRRHLAG
jgi:hypothetical protein